jgi:glycosyltransferase involved in cell wall biosynthesis
MRIIHVVVTDDYAGVESHVSRLARAQADAGHQVVVVGGNQARMAAVTGPSVRVLPGATVRAARRAVAANVRGTDVVHAHMTAAEVVCCSVPRVLLDRVPLVSTRHFGLRRGSRPLGRLTAPVVARVVDAQIAVARDTAQRVEGPSTVVYAGVETAPDRVPPDGTDGPGVVLMVQRLSVEKRGDLGMRAFAASGLADLGWRLQVAGDGYDREIVVGVVADLGLDEAVELLGHRQDVPRLMAAADLFLAPTPGETYGLSVLEAMASGLPVVADGSGGHLETLGADADGLYTSQDPDAAGAVLRQLADDRAAAFRYGSALQARQRRTFSMDQQVTATDAVYRSVLRH